MKVMFNSKVLIGIVVLLLISSAVVAASEFVPLAHQYFRSGFTAISDNGGGSIFVRGETMAKQQVSSVTTIIYLQRFENGSWVTLWSKSGINYGASLSIVSESLNVPRGHFYRLQGFHRVTHNGVVEFENSSSDSIYIN